MVEANPQIQYKSIGIDLGTTNSCAAVVKPTVSGEPNVETIPNAAGKKTTPSVVCFKPNNILVGESAAKLTATLPKKVVYDAKRILGRKFSDDVVQNDKRYWPFDVIEGRRQKPIFNIEESKGKFKQVRPEYVSSYVLSKLRDDASAFLDT